MTLETQFSTHPIGQWESRTHKRLQSKSVHLNKTNLYTSLSIKCSGSARPLLQDELQAGEGGTRYYFDITVHVFRQYFLKDINTVARAAANIKLTEIVTYIM